MRCQNLSISSILPIEAMKSKRNNNRTKVAYNKRSLICWRNLFKMTVNRYKESRSQYLKPKGLETQVWVNLIQLLEDLNHLWIPQRTHLQHISSRHKSPRILSYSIKMMTMMKIFVFLLMMIISVTLRQINFKKKLPSIFINWNMQTYQRE